MTMDTNARTMLDAVENYTGQRWDGTTGGLVNCYLAVTTILRHADRLAPATVARAEAVRDALAKVDGAVWLREQARTMGHGGQ
jgi:hypothetical protein